MKKFNPSVELTENANNTFTVDYTLFTNGHGTKYTEGTVTQTQISSYNSTTKDVPGVQISIIMNETGSGNAPAFSGTIEVDSNLDITTDKPFVELIFKKVNPSTQVLEVVDGYITRGKI